MKLLNDPVKLEKLQKYYKIACFDMDGTLITNTTANLYYAKLLGVEDKVIELEKAFANGEIGSSDFMVIISHITQDLTVDFVQKNFNEIPVISGIEDTVKILKQIGITPIIATTSNILFAECFKQKYGFEYVFGTVHEVFPDGRIGVGVEVCSAEHKVYHVKELSRMIGCTMKEVIAVGDSLSDVPLFSEVECAIAFNYNTALINRANMYVKSDNLLSIFDCLEDMINED